MKITPSARILRMLGEIDFDPWRCIAELVDNSFDDFTEIVGAGTPWAGGFKWERSVLELVRTEAGDKRALARASAYVVNATGLLVMVTVFTATAFIPTGIEIAVAGGTTVAAQKVLEAIFGDQAVRALADQARRDLLGKVNALMDEESERYYRALGATGVDPEAGDRLRDAADSVARARQDSDLEPAGS